LVGNADLLRNWKIAFDTEGVHVLSAGQGDDKGMVGRLQLRHGKHAPMRKHEITTAVRQIPFTPIGYDQRDLRGQVRGEALFSCILLSQGALYQD